MTTDKRLENLIKEAHEVVRYTASKDVKFFAESVISYFEDYDDSVVVSAAQNLVKVKGRHNTEIAFNKLKEAVEAYGKS